MMNLGLGDVLLNTDTKEIFIPNTNTTYKIYEKVNALNLEAGGGVKSEKVL